MSKMNEEHDDPLRSAAAGGDGAAGASSTQGTSFTASAAGGTQRSQQNIASRQSGPRSAYYHGPPGADSAFGTPPVGVIGRDKPREIVRIERDYSEGELCQFHPTFPLELEGRISPTAFSETINDINVIMIQANDASWACFDNTLAVLSLYISPFFLTSKYRREMKKLDARIDEANKTCFNLAGLNIRKPIETAFLFLEVEYF